MPDCCVRPAGVCNNFGRFMTKLTLLAEYARMRFDAHGGYELGNVTVMLEDLQDEGFTLHERLEDENHAQH